MLFVSQAYADPMHRLELRWRPNHIYSKPACGDRHTVTNLLLRVRRRKKTQQSSNSDPSADSNAEVTESQDYEYEGRILGVIDTVYKFQCKHFIGTVVQSYATHTHTHISIYILGIHSIRYTQYYTHTYTHVYIYILNMYIIYTLCNKRLIKGFQVFSAVFIVENQLYTLCCLIPRHG